MKQLINRNPMLVFASLALIGAVFFMCSPASLDQSLPLGIWGIAGFATWGLTALIFLYYKIKK